MRLTTKFQLAAKTKQELRGLYLVIFNKIADPYLSKSESDCALKVLRDIKLQLELKL